MNSELELAARSCKRLIGSQLLFLRFCKSSVIPFGHETFCRRPLGPAYRLRETCAQVSSRLTAIRQSAIRNPSTRHKIIFAGTSLTAGLGLDPDSAYPRLIQEKLDSARLDYESVNGGSAARLPLVCCSALTAPARRLDVFVIESGANDGLRGVAVEAIESNLRSIIQRSGWSGRRRRSPSSDGSAAELWPCLRLGFP